MDEKVNTDNIYELWYLWLKTTNPKTWTPLMRETLIDCEEPFDQWWKECKDYFLPAMETTPLWVIRDEDDYEKHHDESDLENELIIRLNVGLPASTLLKAVKKILDERNMTFPVGRPTFDDSAADIFELYRRPDAPTTRALCTMLSVYQAWTTEQEKKKRGEKPDPMWKIGLRLGLLEGSQSDEPERTMTATVSRYLKWAKTLRKNIVKGSKHFPKYK
jgi:hypothetical protein